VNGILWDIEHLILERSFGRYARESAVSRLLHAMCVKIGRQTAFKMEGHGSVLKEAFQDCTSCVIIAMSYHESAPWSRYRKLWAQYGLKGP
jgi:hypothetical protein